MAVKILIKRGTNNPTGTADLDTNEIGWQSTSKRLYIGGTNPLAIGGEKVAFKDEANTFDENITMAASKKIIQSQAPANANDLANKAYVDGAIEGLNIKEACDFATTQNLLCNYDGETGILTGSDNGSLGTIDGHLAAVGERLLVKDQSAGVHNGIYIVLDLGSPTTKWVLTRADDANAIDELDTGTYVYVEDGTANGGGGFVISQGASEDFPTTGDIIWTKFSSATIVESFTDLGDTPEDYASHGNALVIVRDLESELDFKDIGSNGTFLKSHSGALVWANVALDDIGAFGDLEGITTGDIIYWDGTDFAKLSGVDGQFLKSNGATAPVFSQIRIDDIDGNTQGGILYVRSDSSISDTTAGTEGNILLQGSMNVPQWSDILDGGSWT
jgi:hypothetical protein